MLWAGAVEQEGSGVPSTPHPDTIVSGRRRQRPPQTSKCSSEKLKVRGASTQE